MESAGTEQRRAPGRERKVGLVLAAIGLCGAAALGATSCAFAQPAYRGPVTDHFDGRVFYDGIARRGLGDLIRWQRQRTPPAWPAWIESPPGEKPPQRVDGQAMRVTFVNHATVLVQAGGVNMLTDPIWSERASPVSFAGPKRVRAPGIRFEDLPSIDLVLISHSHYDHLDLGTLERIARAHSALFVSGLGNDLLLKQHQIPGARALDWWQSLEHKGAFVTSVPTLHWGNRSLNDADEALWSAFVVETKAGRFYFAGDTGYGPHFAAVGKRFPGLRLAILPIGAYKPEWFMAPMHQGPAEAIMAQRDLGAATAVAMHFGTFPLGDDGIDEAPDVLRQALATSPGQRFWVLGFGEGREVP